MRRARTPSRRGQASPETLILANGFSCRAQIEELAGRRPLHLAELLDMSLRERERNLQPVA